MGQPAPDMWKVPPNTEWGSLFYELVIPFSCSTYNFIKSSFIYEQVKYFEIAFEIVGTLDFIKDIGHRIVESTGEKRSTSYRIAMAIQHDNSRCILETVVDSRKLDEVYRL